MARWNRSTKLRSTPSTRHCLKAVTRWMSIPNSWRSLNMPSAIRPKDRDAVIQSLRAGVVPRAGQHLVQVARGREIEALVADIDRVADGGSSFRFVIGEYGAGKT